MEKQIQGLSLAPSYSFEREVRLDSEKTLLLETNCSKMDIDGEPHIIRVSKVIKKGVIAEEVKLMQSNKDYTTFFNAIDDFMLVVGFDGKVIDTNDAVEKYLGYSRKELRSIHLKTLFEEKRVEEIREIISNVKKTGKEIYTTPFYKKNGERIVLESKIVLGTWKKEKVLFIISKDVSSYILSKEKFSMSFRINPAACAIFDASDGKYIEFNNTFYELFETNEEEIMNETSCELGIFDEKDIIAAGVKLMKGEKVKNEEGIFRTRKGGTVIGLLSVENRIIQDREYRYISVIDVTALRNAEATIRKQVEFQKILTSISTNYINLPLDNMEPSITQSIQEICVFLGIDRGYLIRYEIRNSLASSTYEWCSKDISSQHVGLQQISLDSMGDIFSQHSKGEKIQINDIDTLVDISNPYLRQLHEDGVKITLTIPLMEDNKIIGFVGFDSVGKNREYNESELSLLNVFSQLLVNIWVRKRQNILLEYQELKYRNVITNMKLGFVELDLNMKIKHANDMFLAMLGYSLDEIVGTPISNYIQSTEEGKESKLSSAIVGPIECEIGVRTKEGENRWWIFTGVPNYSILRKIDGMIAIPIDITERKKIEIELGIALKHS